MRVIDCIQGSEEWERLRARPTASQFHRICTPAKGQFAASAIDYAGDILAKRAGIWVEPPPSYWMEWGVEHEGEAKEAYTSATGNDVVDAGFIMPDHTDAYGGSPDGLVPTDGILEVKCPSPQKLFAWHIRSDRDDDYFPLEHKAQCQGLLWISGRAWIDFFAWHPGMKPLLITLLPDLEYHERLSDCMDQMRALLDEYHQHLLYGE